MNNSIEKNILNQLLDKYEKSKSFIGENKVNQFFSLNIEKAFPSYADHSKLNIYESINDAIEVLQRKGFISGTMKRDGSYTKVILCMEKVDEIYNYMGRTTKKSVQLNIQELLEAYLDKNDILQSFCVEQLARIRKNKSVQYYNLDIDEFEKILHCLDEIFKVEQETYQRDFSVRVFSDSKVFERIQKKVKSILYKYGEFPEEDTIFQNLNIVKNPTNVQFKGQGIVVVSDQVIDVSKLKGDIGLSSMLLPDISEILATRKSVLTVENLTTFHSVQREDALILYLGGYHNRVRRDFIKKIADQNPGINFFHFGDIDAGGFYILEHLIRMTGVVFEPLYMDVSTLKKYAPFTKKLTDNDRKRLKCLLDSSYQEVIQYMLDHDCKLEQEAVIF